MEDLWKSGGKRVKPKEVGRHTTTVKSNASEREETEVGKNDQLMLEVYSIGRPVQSRKSRDPKSASQQRQQKNEAICTVTMCG